MTTTVVRLKERRGASGDWASENPIPDAAQFCVEVDTGLFKIGDGVRPYNDLPYAGGAGALVEGILSINNDPGDDNGAVFLGLTQLLDVTITPTQYNDDGTVVPGTGPQPGDYLGLDPVTGLFVNQPLQGVAPEGWFAPYTTFSVALDFGEILPPDAPSDLLVFSAADPGRKLLERVNTVLTSGAAVTLPDVYTATMHDVTITADCTITLPTAVAGASITLLLREDGTGGHAITLSPALRGTTPTWVTTANTENLVELVSVGGSGWRVRSPLQTGSAGTRPGATPTVRGAFHANAAASNSLTSVSSTLPAGIVAGDLGYMEVSMNGQPATPYTLTPPSGWTVVDGPVAAGSQTTWLLRRVMDGSESGAAISSGTVSAAGRPSMTGVVVAGGTTTGEVIVSNQDVSPDLILDVPPVTPLVGNSLLVHLAATRTNQSTTTTPLSAQNITHAPGWTEVTEHSEGRWADPTQVNFGGYVESLALTGQGNVQQAATQATYLSGDPATERSYVIAVPPPVS